MTMRIVLHGGFAEKGRTCLGVEVDGFGRALAYWIRQRHDNDLRVRMDSLTDRVERVPADQIIHIKRTVRWQCVQCSEHHGQIATRRLPAGGQEHGGKRRETRDVFLPAPLY